MGQMVAHRCIRECIFFVSTSSSRINHIYANSVSPGTETKVRMENFLEEVPQKQCVWVVFVTPHFL